MNQRVCYRGGGVVHFPYNVSSEHKGRKYFIIWWPKQCQPIHAWDTQNDPLSKLQTHIPLGLQNSSGDKIDHSNSSKGIYSQTLNFPRIHLSERASLFLSSSSSLFVCLSLLMRQGSLGFPGTQFGLPMLPRARIKGVPHHCWLSFLSSSLHWWGRGSPSPRRKP